MGKDVAQPHPFFITDPKPWRDTYREGRRQERALAGKTKVLFAEIKQIMIRVFCLLLFTSNYFFTIKIIDDWPTV